MRDKFNFSILIYGALTQLNESDFTTMTDAVLDYGLNGRVAHFNNDRLDALFVLIQGIIDRDNATFEGEKRE